MRSKRVEAAVKADYDFKPVGTNFTNWSIEQILDEHTNAGSDRFCPFIDHMKLAKALSKTTEESGILYRYAPLSMQGSPEYNIENTKNLRYHWIQIGFKSFQYCQWQRDPVTTDEDLCEKNFKKCSVYRESIKGTKHR